HPGADLGDADRVGDELVAGAAQLVGVAVAGEIEGAGERLAVDLGRRVELLDYGEEIGEELLLLYGLLRRSRYRVPSW
ncbi:MAG TPA: hypothetical protein VKU40_14620, partial [Thermoanaerobaculia bacterium]|nr:hypothetical protein [Thermoanaerobaculia bacterium]